MITSLDTVLQCSGPAYLKYKYCPAILRTLKDRVLDPAKLILGEQIPEQVALVEPELVDVSAAAEVEEVEAVAPLASVHTAADQPADGGPVFCDGSRCSVVDGVQLGALDTCILKREPLPDGEPLEAIEYAVESNWAFDNTNRAKRFALYLFYAKCVFHATGRNNRIRLPGCLVAEIRRRFPNPVGVPYVGYKPPPNLNRNVVLMC